MCEMKCDFWQEVWSDCGWDVCKQTVALLPNFIKDVVVFSILLYFHE